MSVLGQVAIRLPRDMDSFRKADAGPREKTGQVR
jgi:hypothetical protein